MLPKIGSTHHRFRDLALVLAVEPATSFVTIVDVLYAVMGNRDVNRVRCIPHVILQTITVLQT
jgi:hypothetical protein